MKKKPRIMLSFRDGAEGSGPFNSHLRIINSNLSKSYDFQKLMLPKGRLGVFNVKLLKKLVQEIKEQNPDVVHFSGLQLEGFYVSLACKIASKKSICAIRGSSLEALDISLFKKSILSLYELFTILISTSIYANSNYVGNWFRLKLVKKRFFGTIYNFPPVFNDTKEEDEVDLRGVLNISEDSIVVISTGRVTLDKGADIIIDLIKTGIFSDKVHLVILGEGSELQAIINCANKYKYINNVHCLGYTENIYGFLKNSNIFISCSKHETLGNSIIEAALSGLPIVAKRTGGIPEIVEHNRSGYLVEKSHYLEYVNALRILIESPGLRSLMGDESRSLINTRFDRDYISHNLKSLYEKMVSCDDR